MRARLNLMTGGVTLLVVIAFLVPLGFLVSQQADQRGRLEAERTAQTLAALVVRSTAGLDGEPASAGLEGLIGPIPEGSVVILPDGSRLGPGDPDEALIAEVLSARTALSAYSPVGFGIAIPVATGTGTTVVYSSVPSALLDEGVLRAWGLLALLGVGLVVAALFVSDRLGRTVVGPSERIASAAERLGHGDLDTRVDEEGPPELVAIAASFNQLARRIRALLAAEREQVADLSHRLRTPLTALRLQVEQIGPEAERTAILDKVDRLRRAVDELINEARRAPEEGPVATDVIAVLGSRAAFWKVLADEQDRGFHVDLGDQAAPVAVAEPDAAAAFDALIGNVFAHTDSGTDFGILARVGEGSVEIEVSDSGAGFPAGMDPVRRGQSGGGSSGLGLDIALRFADTAGGSLRIGPSHSGGARVVVELPLISDSAQSQH